MQCHICWRNGVMCKWPATMPVGGYSHTWRHTVNVVDQSNKVHCFVQECRSANEGDSLSWLGSEYAIHCFVNCSISALHVQVMAATDCGTLSVFPHYDICCCCHTSYGTCALHIASLHTNDIFSVIKLYLKVICLLCMVFLCGRKFSHEIAWSLTLA